MKRKGIKFKRANHLGWRGAQEGDTYMDGSPIEKPYVVIVSQKDCKIVEREGRKYYQAEDAPPIDLDSHSRTNMAYGKRRSYSNKNYDTQSVYWVEDAYVYRGSIHVEMPPEEQPKEGWYDCEGSYYILQAQGMDWETASDVIGTVNKEFGNRSVALMRKSRSSENLWDVYVQAKHVKDVGRLKLTTHQN